MILFLTGWPMAAAVIAAAAGTTSMGEKGRWRCAAGAVLIELAAAVICLAAVANGASFRMLRLESAVGMGLYLTMDGFRSLYVTLAVFLWTVSTLLSGEYMQKHSHQGRYYFFLLVTLGTVAGMFFSADLFTTFVFFEIMSLTSYVWVAQEETCAALRAAETYLAVAVIGGMVLLMGLFLVYHDTGTLMIDALPGAVSAMAPGRKLAAGLCMLFGFGAKAGAVPLHIWLPKAHPVAPAPASALLSGMLTKAGIFGILVLSLWMFAGEAAWGSLILTIGTLTMLTGAVLALFSVDLKRTLACSSVSQIGFILVGIGTAVLLGRDNDLAVKGTLLHMVNHSLIKLVLFCAAGVVFMNLHQLNLNEIRGFGRKKPLLAAVFLTGAWSIAGLPLGGGYASKSLLHEALLECMEAAKAMTAETGAGYPAYGVLKLAECLFLFSGGLTLAYMLKLSAALFWEKNQDDSLQQKYDKLTAYWNPVSKGSLCAAAVILLIWGLLPGLLMDGAADLAKGFLGHSADLQRVAYYQWENLKGAGISIVIGVIVYGLVVRKWMIQEGRYVNRWPDRLDLEDRIYRPLLACLLFVLSAILRFCDRLTDTLIIVLRRTVYRDSPLPHELEEGTVATHVVGVLMDDGKKVLNHTVYKKHPIRGSFEHKLALLHSELDETSMIIGRSLSFGLMLFCIGLLLTLIYLLL